MGLDSWGFPGHQSEIIKKSIRRTSWLSIQQIIQTQKKKNKNKKKKKKGILNRTGDPKIIAKW